jgi:hypothetical protein
MQIVDLSEERKELFCLCLEDWSDEAKPPRWFPKVDKKPASVPGRVTVTAFSSGWCQAQNLTYERAKRASAEFADAVMFREIDTSERSALAEWGQSDAVFVDGRNLQKGPPPSYEKIHKAIDKRVRRLPH